jgi:hypothetical protein
MLMHSVLDEHGSCGKYADVPSALTHTALEPTHTPLGAFGYSLLL